MICLGFPEEEDEDEASEPSLSNYLRTLGLRNVPDNAEAYPLEDRRSRSHHAGSSAMKQSEMLPAESMAHGMSLDFAEPLRMSAGQPSTIHSDPETDTGTLLLCLFCLWCRFVGLASMKQPELS